MGGKVSNGILGCLIEVGVLVLKLNAARRLLFVINFIAHVLFLNQNLLSGGSASLIGEVRVYFHS